MSGVVEHRERISDEPALAFATLLDVDVPDLHVRGLPPLWHWLYLTAWPDQRDLGPDGHPRRGGIPNPPEPGRRRMWAGGEVRTHRPLLVGQEAVKSSRVLAVEEKTGRSGRLTFARVGHTVTQGDNLCVEEIQHVVYRVSQLSSASPSVPSEAIDAPQDGDWSVEIDPTVLFRFSALTKNAHRIHYDLQYARDVEGYAGLVTHGPLQALIMAEAARSSGATGPSSFEYRLVTPLLAQEGLVARATAARTGAWDTTIRNCAGRLTATGRFEVA